MDMLRRCGIVRQLFSLKTWAAKYGTALIGCEENRGLRSAFRTRSLRAKRLSGPTVAFRSALLTAFRVVLKLLVAEEKLLNSRKRKFSPAILTNQISINKIHTTFRMILGFAPADNMTGRAQVSLERA